MKKLLLTTVAFTALFSSAAYTGQATTYSKVVTSDEPITEKVGPQPYDFSTINQSPIRGKGQIHVQHNMPIPGDPDRNLHDALWLLQDNGYQCSGRRR